MTNEGASPVDREHLAASVVFLIGVATLLPWNFMLTANDFWMYKFRDVGHNSTSFDSTDDETLTPLQLTFNSYLTITSSVPLIVFLLLNTAVSEHMPINPRIEWSIFLNIVVFATIAVVALIDTDHYQELFLACTLATVAIVNSLAGVLSGGGTGAVSYLPEKYMAIKSVGQAVAGVLACIAQILCLQGELSPSHSAFLYFTVATMVLLLSQAGFSWLKNSEFYRFYVKNKSSVELTSESSDSLSQTWRATPFFRIFKDGWEHHVAITLTLAFTLACFPAITVLIRPGPEETIENSRLFVPIICFLVFNVADCLGRMLGGYLPTPIQWRCAVLLASVARVIFIPLFLFCNVAPHNRFLTSVHFAYTWQYTLIMVAFGVSNGYIITVTMAQAPKATLLHYQEVAGSMVVAFDAVGIFAGSMCSYAVLKLL